MNLLEQTGANKYKLALLRKVIANRDNTDKTNYTLPEIADLINDVYDKLIQPVMSDYRGCDLNEIHHFETNKYDS
jgi:hypothetical protein